MVYENTTLLHDFPKSYSIKIGAVRNEYKKIVIKNVLLSN